MTEPQNHLLNLLLTIGVTVGLLENPVLILIYTMHAMWPNDQILNSRVCKLFPTDGTLCPLTGSQGNGFSDCFRVRRAEPGLVEWSRNGLDVTTHCRVSRASSRAQSLLPVAINLVYLASSLALLVSRPSGLLTTSLYDPTIHDPSHLRCSPDVHIPPFQIFPSTVYPWFWLPTFVPLSRLSR